MQERRGGRVGAVTAVRRRAVCGAGALAWLPAGQLRAAEAFVLRIETIQSEPFGRLGPRGPGGLMYDLGNLIAARAGLAAQNRVVPYARTVLSLRNGDADMVLRFSNAELEVVSHQVAPVLALPTVLVSRREAPLRGLEDLSGRVVAVSRSFPVPDSVARLPGLHVYEVNSNEHAIQMLMSRRVDAVYGSNLGLFGAARELGLRMSAFARPLAVERQTFWLHLSRRTATPALIDKLAAAVDTLQRDGTIARHYELALAEFGDDRMPA